MTSVNIEELAAKITVDEYFALSEERKVVTPENIGDLISYPALFKAMQDDRELRPALSEAMTTGRALADFLGMSADEFSAKYAIADGPVNPKTGKPYGAETKAYAEWLALQEKTPVSSATFNMFGKMAAAYNGHAYIKTLPATQYRNVIMMADVAGVPCACKIDSLYVSGDAAFAVDVTTTSDIDMFRRSAASLHYFERAALIELVLSSKGLPAAPVRIAAIEKGPIPRCGVFVSREHDANIDKVAGILGEYAESEKTGVYGTRYEAPMVI